MMPTKSPRLPSLLFVAGDGDGAGTAAGGADVVLRAHQNLPNWHFEKKSLSSESALTSMLVLPRPPTLCVEPGHVWPPSEMVTSQTDASAMQSTCISKETWRLSRRGTTRWQPLNAAHFRIASGTESSQ
eukprot:CAMPEP_0115449416 /NCGR_PEP_ID=MMETSP0271-20121206/41001_1 /TAXON_ID=71861 /ORGANISM="Scrippsiella trochoidea, Strain CCMP3099" /LENGTH=128 /DNA_ID=CAMNT_0002875579 /DNA_START=281 /DNA_END=667 /DNA_ORIENTATION=+